MTGSAIEKLKKTLSSIMKRAYLSSADMKLPVSLRLRERLNIPLAGTGQVSHTNIGSSQQWAKHMHTY